MKLPTWQCRTFARQSLGDIVLPFVGKNSFSPAGIPKTTSMQIKPSVRLIRHATLFIDIQGVTLLVDPMFSGRNEMEPVANAAQAQRIPMQALPFSDKALKQLIAETDAVVVTHLHRDHWDARAIELIPKDKPVFCQPADEATIQSQGFTQVWSVRDTLTWKQIDIIRTSGRHGTGETGQKMGIVSGFVLKRENAPTLYIAGDTIWCEEVKEAIRQHQPQLAVVNAGAAQFLTGDPVTMTAQDVKQVCLANSSMKVMAVHMDTVNHCLLSRKQLGDFISLENLTAQVLIPADGKTIQV